MVAVLLPLHRAVPLWGEGESQSETGPHAGLALHADADPVGLGHVADDGEPQSGGLAVVA